MSYIISNKQYLAPNESRAQYEPIIFEEEGLEVERMDVSFGHPLYTTAADIYNIKSLADENRILPVVPDGCMSLVFHGNGETEKIEAYVCGAIDEIKKIEIKPKDYFIVIRFLPGIGYSLLNDNAGSITNKTLPIKNNLIGGDQIISILHRETHLEGRIRLISKIIRIHLHNEPNKYLIKYCTDRIFQTQGNIRVEDLAEETGFTSRYIGKMFEKCVGLSPKLFSQVIRLQLSIKMIIENREKLLVDIAVDTGFFDHPHMNRMYKKILHCSSGDFRKKMLSDVNYEEICEYIREA